MLLDDPLSALDATVAQEVYKNAVVGVLAETCADGPLYLWRARCDLVPGSEWVTCRPWTQVRFCLT